jgi:hypothetical protein
MIAALAWDLKPSIGRTPAFDATVVLFDQLLSGTCSCRSGSASIGAGSNGADRSLKRPRNLHTLVKASREIVTECITCAHRIHSADLKARRAVNDALSHRDDIVGTERHHQRRTILYLRERSHLKLARIRETSPDEGFKFGLLAMTMSASCARRLLSGPEGAILRAFTIFLRLALPQRMLNDACRYFLLEEKDITTSTPIEHAPQLGGRLMVVTRSILMEPNTVIMAIFRF